MAPLAPVTGLGCVDALLAEPQALEQDRDAECGNEKGADNRRPGANLAQAAESGSLELSAIAARGAAATAATPIRFRKVFILSNHLLSKLTHPAPPNGLT